MKIAYIIGPQQHNRSLRRYGRLFGVMISSGFFCLTSLNDKNRSGKPASSFVHGSHKRTAKHPTARTLPTTTGAAARSGWGRSAPGPGLQHREGKAGGRERRASELRAGPAHARSRGPRAAPAAPTRPGPARRAAPPAPRRGRAAGPGALPGQPGRGGRAAASRSGVRIRRRCPGPAQTPPGTAQAGLPDGGEGAPPRRERPAPPRPQRERSGRGAARGAPALRARPRPPWRGPHSPAVGAPHPPRGDRRPRGRGPAPRRAPRAVPGAPTAPLRRGRRRVRVGRGRAGRRGAGSAQAPCPGRRSRRVPAGRGGNEPDSNHCSRARAPRGPRGGGSAPAAPARPSARAVGGRAGGAPRQEKLAGRNQPGLLFLPGSPSAGGSAGRSLGQLVVGCPGPGAILPRRPAALSP